MKWLSVWEGQSQYSYDLSLRNELSEKGMICLSCLTGKFLSDFTLV